MHSKLINQYYKIFLDSFLKLLIENKKNKITPKELVKLKKRSRKLFPVKIVLIFYYIGIIQFLSFIRYLIVVL